jgi:uncharacterized membrane protein
MNGDDPEELRRQLAALTNRVTRLERSFELLGRGMPPAEPGAATIDKAATPAAEPPQNPPSPPSRELLTPSRPVPVPPSFRSPTSKGSAPTQPTVTPDLERQLGSHIFNRIGILAVLIGMAWFLKFAFDNHWIGPLGRVLIGLLVGIGLIGWSEWFRRHTYTVFSYSLKAIGSGVLYLSLWAAYSLYGLIPSGAAFAAMALVTAWNGYMAWAQDAELLAVYAMIGGFFTPVLVSTGQNHEIALFTYVLILDLVVFALVGARPWFRLMLGAFIGTQALLAGWTSAFYADDQFASTAFFIAAFFLIFTIAPRRFRAAPEGSRRAAQNHFVLTVLPLVNAGLTFLAYYNMLDTPERRWAHPWLAVGFAAFYLGLLQFPTVRAEDAGSRAKDVVSAMYLAFAVIFLTIAMPLATHGHWLAICWLVEGVVLLWAASRTKLTILRALAIGTLVLGGGAVATLDGNTAVRLIFNARFTAYLVAVASYVAVARIAMVQDAERDPSAPRVTDLSASIQWRGIAAVAVIAANLFALFGVALEIHTYWAVRQFPEYTYEQFSYSMWCMLYGGALLAVGLWKRSAFLRWQALLLIVFSIGKVFIVDTSELSQGYRILSFLGLGVLLLAISFVYQRDWLGLREAPSKTGADDSPREGSPRDTSAAGMKES